MEDGIMTMVTVDHHVIGNWHESGMFSLVLWIFNGVGGCTTPRRGWMGEIEDGINPKLVTLEVHTMSSLK